MDKHSTYKNSCKKFYNIGPRMIKKIKLPDSGGLEAAAADFGAQRAAIIASAAPAAVVEPEPEPEVDVFAEQKKLETKDEEEEDEELC